VAIAASSGTGVGLSGSGVESTNKIATLINAYVDGGNSTPKTLTADNITITADDTAEITANAGAASIAVSVASNAAVSLSIGVALAHNEVSNEVAAYVDNAAVSTVDGDGNTPGNIVIAAATNQPTLFDLDGTFDSNLITAIANLDDAATTDDDDSDTAANEAEVDFDADVVFKQNLRQAFADAGETLRHTAYTASVLLADLFDPITITKGLKVADASGNVFEYISDTDGGTLQTTQVFTDRSLWRAVDDLTIAVVDAGKQWSVYDGRNTYLLRKVLNDVGTEVLRIFDATIETVAVAASIAAGFSSTTGVALSGAGAEATNTILTKTNAFLRDSSLTSDGTVDLDANNAAGIVATIASVSVAAGIGTGTAGVAASIGVSMARNRIGKSVESLTLSELQALPDVLKVTGQSLYTTGSGEIVLKRGDFVRIEAGPGAGEIYQYGGATLTEAVDLSLVDYQTENWHLANLTTDSPVEVQAYLENSSVNAGGDLDLTAISEATIQAGVFAGSVAIGGGGTAGVGLSGVGVNSRNDINKLVKAYVSGDGATGITANAITATAKDSSTISADTAAASIAGTVGGTAGVSISIGVSLAKNDISNVVEASILNADNGVTARTGNLTLDADEVATIDAFSLATSLAAGFSGTVGVALSGAGANALNSINNTVQSFVSASTLTTQGSTGSVVVDADSEASISSLVGGLSAAIGVGGTVGVAGSLGIAIARNLIGIYDVDDDLATEHNQVLAYIDGSSTVTSAKHVQVTATANDTISTVSFAGSAAISGGTVAVSAAGSGAEATSILNTRVAAYIANSNVAASGDIKVNADSTSEVSKALAIGASLSVAIGIGGAVSVAASVAKNVISNEVQASLSGNTGNMITASGQIDVTANATAGIGQDNGDDNVEISAVTASLAAGAFSASGGGLEIINTIDNDVDAYINGALTVGAAGDINVRANETAYLEADASNVAVAIGVGAGAAALGLATVENKMLSDIEAWVNQATVTSANTTVRAVADTNVAKTFSVGVSAAIDLYSLAVADNTANVEIATLTKAYATNATLFSTGDIFINASSDNYARTDASGGALGAVAIGAMIADIALGKGHGVDEVVAEIGDNTSVTANALTISASSIDDLLSDSIAAGGGAIAASGAVANTSSDQATLARIGTNANLNITTSLTVGSTHVQDVDASADSYSIALASGSGAGVSNQINSKANIEIAANATVVANNIDIEARNEAHKDEYLTDSNLRSGSASLGNITVLQERDSIWRWGQSL
jgi:hypothetical protein